MKTRKGEGKGRVIGGDNEMEKRREDGISGKVREIG
jgi:hypothetical protein